MTLIASFSTGEEPPKPPTEKKLQYTGRFVCKEKPINGVPPSAFVTTDFLELMPDGHEYTTELPIKGVDVCREMAYLRPLFEFERLGDGHSTEDRVQALRLEMKREVRRMRSEPAPNISTVKALALLRPDLCALHDLGYTIDELLRLVRGSLRISITDEELLDVMLNP